MPKAAKDVGKLASSHIAGGSVNWYKSFERKFGKCIKNIKSFVSCDPVIPLHQIYSKEVTQNVGESTSYPEMFIIERGVKTT